jgi:hypothetical protein
VSSAIADRVARVRERIAEAAARRGAGPEVKLVGVGKRQRAESLRAAYHAGLVDFGENYAQELRAKARALADLPLRWHFVGALQTNKVRQVVGCALIHTVDRPALLSELEKRAAGRGLLCDVLLEVGFGEVQKAGAPPELLPALLDAFAATPHVRCRGLMALPPEGPLERTREYFRRLRALRDTLAATARPNVELVELSMGMSGDYEAAVEEGATIVRVGTAIFGQRPA